MRSKNHKLDDSGILTPRQRVFEAISFHMNRLTGFDGRPDHDEKLMELSKGVGHVAQSFHLGNECTRGHLLRIAAYAAGWADNLQAMGEAPAMRLMADERARQDDLLRKGKLLYNCSSIVASPRRKLRVLVEEMGEVAQAIDDIERAVDHGMGSVERKKLCSHLRTELIQVAAVCAAWMESLEVKS